MSSETARENGKDQTIFNSVVESYLQDFHFRHPTMALCSGFHDWDGCLEDLSRDALAEEAHIVRGFLGQLSAISADGLPQSDRLDLRLLINNAHARLHDIETIRWWEKNPQTYGDTLATGVLSLVMFDQYCETNTCSAIASRLNQAPRLIESARLNIENTAPVFVKHGITSIAGALRLVENSLPKMFGETASEGERSNLLRAVDQASRSLREFLSYLKNDLANRASGNFALGQAAYDAKLRYEEGVNVSSQELLKIGLERLRETDEDFRRTAAIIDAKADANTVWQQMKEDHPEEGQLVPTAEAQLEALIRFIEDRKIVSLNGANAIKVGLTPEFLQWTFASLWPLGAFENSPFAARYLITDVAAHWSESEKRQHLSYFAYPVLWIISMHEAYPGHAVQFSHLKNVESRLRRVLGLAPGSFVEGWAHYSEQMMIDQGFGDGDPRIRLGQLSQSLIRLCRLIVSIKMHTEDMSIDQATRFFMDNARCERLPARAEAERGAFDPGYLTYALGKIEIETLRDEFKQAAGDRFSLREFHDRLLGIGMAPLWVHRELVLGSESGVSNADS
jgi:uncharacterized protein (DUF885 family)